MNTSMSKRTQMLCVSAMMIALATILSLISKFIPALEMPFGGSITLCSMVPIVYISYRYGVKWGLFSGFVYSVLQILTGMSALKGLSAGSLVASLFLDYFIAFTVLGLGGMFRKTIPNKTLGFTLGVVVAGLLRFTCHVISGFLLWATRNMTGSPWTASTAETTKRAWTLPFRKIIIPMMIPARDPCLPGGCTPTRCITTG